MTWSYSFNPGSSAKDNVRFLIGDTDKGDQLLHDEELLYLLATNRQDPYAAALVACEAIMAKLSRAIDESVGSVSVKFSQRLAGYEKLLTNLRRKQAFGSGIRPYCGGMTQSDVRSLQMDRNAVQPQFRVDQRRGYFGWGSGSTGIVIDGTELNGQVDGISDGESGGLQLVVGQTSDVYGGADVTYGDDAITPAEIAAGVTGRGEHIYTGTQDPDANTPGDKGDYFFNSVTKTLFGPYQ